MTNINVCNLDDCHVVLVIGIISASMNRLGIFSQRCKPSHTLYEVNIVFLLSLSLRGAAAMDQQIEDLAAHIHASCVELVFKVHDEKHTSWEEAQKAARRPAVRIMLESKVFHELRRCEPNCDLDAGTLHLLELALPRLDIVRVKMALAKVLLCPCDGMLSALEDEYSRLTRSAQKGDVWSDSTACILSLKL